MSEEKKIEIPNGSNVTKDTVDNLISSLGAHGVFSHSYTHTSSVVKEEQVGKTIHHNLHGKKEFGDGYTAMTLEEIAAAEKATMSYTLVEIVGTKGNSFVLKETDRDTAGKVVNRDVTVGVFANINELNSALNKASGSFVDGFDSRDLFNKVLNRIVVNDDNGHKSTSTESAVVAKPADGAPFTEAKSGPVDPVNGLTKPAVPETGRGGK